MSKTFLFQAIQFSQTVLFQTIQFNISTVSMSKSVLFQVIQFSVSTQISSIWPIDRTLSGATTPSQSWPGSNGNEGVLCIPQSSSITGTSPSDCLVSYTGHSLVGSYPSAEKQSVYSTAPANWARLVYRFLSFNWKSLCSKGFSAYLVNNLHS